MSIKQFRSLNKPTYSLTEITYRLLYTNIGTLWETHTVRQWKDQRSDAHRRLSAGGAAHIFIGVRARRGDIR